MQQLYLETRQPPTHPPMTLAFDIARHLQRRQNLGKTLIICEYSTALLSATRKQWLKSARQLQRLRASTLNAEEILRLTHAVMRMHNMHFTTKTIVDAPHAEVYFASADQLKLLPLNCYTVYLTAPLPAATLKKMLAELPEGGLIVQYTTQTFPPGLKIKPKEALEQNVLMHWEKLTALLRQHNVHPDKLVVGNSLQFDAMDEALDVLLGVSDSFLRRTAPFQRAIELAQPFTSITSAQQKTFESVTRLAYRVQALSPTGFGGYLRTTFNDSAGDMYFLRDASSELYADLEFAAAQALDLTDA